MRRAVKGTLANDSASWLPTMIRNWNSRMPITKPPQYLECRPREDTSAIPGKKKSDGFLSLTTDLLCFADWGRFDIVLSGIDWISIVYLFESAATLEL